MKNYPLFDRGDNFLCITTSLFAEFLSYLSFDATKHVENFVHFAIVLGQISGAKKGTTMLDDLWRSVLGEVELTISRGNYVTWFKNTCILKRRDDLVIIGVGNVFVKQQLERKYNDLIVSQLEKNGISPVRVEYKIHSKIAHAAPEEEQVLLSNAPSSSPVTQANNRQNTLTHSYRQGLNE